MMKKASKMVGAVLAVALMAFPYVIVLLPALAGEFMEQIDIPMNINQVVEEKITIAMVVLYAVIVLANIVWAIVWSVTGGDSEWILLWNLLIRCGYFLVWFLLGMFLLVGLILWSIGGKETAVQAGEIMALLLPAFGVYGICGNILAVKEQYISVGLAVAMSILQFVPLIDLISAIITYCTVNTQRKKSQYQQVWINRV